MPGTVMWHRCHTRPSRESWYAWNDHDRRALLTGVDSIGVIAGCEVVIKDLKGNILTDPGVEGELCYRGRHIMMGYLANPKMGVRRVITWHYWRAYSLVSCFSRHGVNTITPLLWCIW